MSENLSPSLKKRKRDDSDDATIGAGPSSIHPDTPNREEKRKSKKQKKKSVARPAVFAFDSADLRSRAKPVSIQDIRSLVLAVAEDTPANIAPKFISAPGRSSINHIVVLHIPGITPDVIGMSTPPTYEYDTQKKIHPSSMFAGAMTSKPSPTSSSSSSPPAFPLTIATKRPENHLPAMSKLFSHGLPTRTHGDGNKLNDVMNAFLLGPPARNQKPEGRSDSGLFGEASTTVEALILSPSELEKEMFLLPSSFYGPSEIHSTQTDVSTLDLSYIANGWDNLPEVPQRTDDWVEAPPPDIKYPKENQVVLALDCEMVDTARGKELARIAVVDFWTETVVFDELVKPAAPIIDYLTQYSGMTAAMLDPVTTSLSVIQQRLLGVMQDSSAILIGHHISNDLRALKLAHARCIDTSVVFDNLSRPGYKPSLKWLAQRWLGINIQSTASANGAAIVGHRPEEDAKACIALVKKKIELGLEFGRTPDAKITIFQRLKVAGMSSAYVGGASKKYGSTADTSIECHSDAEIVDSVINHVKTHYFVFGRMGALSQARGWGSHSTNSKPSATLSEAEEEALKSVNQELKKLTASLPPSTALILYTGCSDPRHVGSLHRKKASWDQKIRSGVKNDAIPVEERWTTSDAERLESECQLAKAGLAFFCITLGA